MGCGKIAYDFATAMKLLPKEEHQVRSVWGLPLGNDQRLVFKIVAVAAGDLKRAQEFADHFGVKHAFDSYEKLANFADVGKSHAS